MAGKTVTVTVMVFLISVLCFGQNERRNDLKESKGAPFIIKNDIDLSKISIRSLTPLNIPPYYTEAGYLREENLLMFGYAEPQDKKNYELSTYVIMNRHGETIRKIDRVYYWDGGDQMLRVNQLSSLLYYNLSSKKQKIVKLDPEKISRLEFSRFDDAFYYSLGVNNRISCYEIGNGNSREVFEVGQGILSFFSMLTPEDVVYAVINHSVSLGGKYDYTSEQLIEIPMYIGNIRQKKSRELLKLNGNGVLTFFHEETRSLNFVVEEKGILRFISSDANLNNHRINLSPIIVARERAFDGVMLTLAKSRGDGQLFAATRAKLYRKKEPTPGLPLFYSFDPKVFDLQGADIYLFDLTGKYRKLTDTPDQFEQVIGWNSAGDEILYYDVKGKKYYLLELAYGENNFKRPYLREGGASRTIRP